MQAHYEYRLMFFLFLLCGYSSFSSGYGVFPTSPSGGSTVHYTDMLGALVQRYLNYCFCNQRVEGTWPGEHLISTSLRGLNTQVPGPTLQWELSPPAVAPLTTLSFCSVSGACLSYYLAKAQILGFVFWTTIMSLEQTLQCHLNRNLLYF